MIQIEKQIAVLEEKIARERARLSDAKARAAAENRKRDARKKILYGAAYLAGLATLSERQREQSLERVHAQILRERDREFLGLLRVVEHCDPEPGSQPKQASLSSVPANVLGRHQDRQTSAATDGRSDTSKFKE